MQEYDPCRDLADRPHLTLIYRDQGPEGEYHRRTLTISLRHGLSQVKRRCVLAHELVHDERGDVALTEPALNARQELIVERTAARRLIPLHALLDALRWTGHVDEAAEELLVDVTTLRARLDCLTEEERAVLDALQDDWVA